MASRDQIREIRKRHHNATVGPYFWEESIHSPNWKDAQGGGLCTRIATKGRAPSGKVYEKNSILTAAAIACGDEKLRVAFNAAVQHHVRESYADNPGQGAWLETNFCGRREDFEFLAGSWQDIADLLTHVDRLETKLRALKVLVSETARVFQGNADRASADLSKLAEDIEALTGQQ